MFHQLSAKSIHCWVSSFHPPRFWGKYGRADCSYSWRNMMAGETTSWWMRGNKKTDSITTANLVIFHNHSWSLESIMEIWGISQGLELEKSNFTFWVK
jgi:hypothetical protein